MADYNFIDVTVRDSTIKVKRAGSGPPMLMLHGMGGAERFLPGMQALAKQFDVIVPMAPGFGGQEMPPWLETIGDLANFYLDFMDKLDLKSVRLVGLSLGGWVAADLAIKNASRLTHLALMSSPGIEVPGARPLDIFTLGEEAAVRAVYCDEKRADEAWARAQLPENEDVRLMNQRIVARLAWQPRFHDPQMQRWLHRIRIPTLVLWGEDDRLFPPAYGRAWQTHIKHAQFKLFAHCGHLPIQEHAEAFAAAVTQFCAKESVAA
jgi:pimeloyl-ACP methyl ester carboxylesterase